jgi:hypothetical protein
VRYLAVGVLALVFAGVAGAAGAAQAPASVDVLEGTLLRGDAASLAATDGNTLDVSSQQTSDGTYRVFFSAAWHPTPIGFLARYTANVEGHSANCRLTMPNGFPAKKVRLRLGETQSGTWDVTGHFAGGISVKCKAKAPYTLHWDQLTLEAS